MPRVAAERGKDSVNIQACRQRVTGEIKDGKAGFQADVQPRQHVVGGKAFGKFNGRVGMPGRHLDDGIGTPGEIDPSVRLAYRIQQFRLL